MRLKSIFGFLFTRRFISERLLLFAMAGGMLMDGWITAAFSQWTTESMLRILISVFAAAALGYTYFSSASRTFVRALAYMAIGTLLAFVGYLLVLHHFSYDDSLTFLGAFLICSLYFRSMGELAAYLVAGLLLASIGLLLVENPQVNPQMFVLRLTLGAILVLGLSYATRQFQEQLHRFSKQVAEENRSLNETRIALEERLTAEHLLALVASRVNSVVMISDASDRIEWVNQEFTKVTGYSMEEVVGRTPEFLRGPGTDENIVRQINEKKARLESFHATILNYRKDGKPVWVQMHVTPLLDTNGKLERFIAVQEDITEFKITEEELRQSREQLKAAQQHAKIGSWEWNDRSETISISDEMARMLGMEGWKQAPIPLVMSRVHPDDVDVLRKSIQNGLRRRSPFEVDFRLIAGGITRNVYLTGQAIASKTNDRTEKLVGTMQDITERKKIEEEMRLAEKQYRSLFEHSQHMICMHDLDGTILSINPAGAHAVGYEPEEVIGRNIKTFFYAGKTAEYDEYMRTISLKGSVQGLLRLRVRGGSTVVWMYNNVLLTGPEGQPFVLSSNVEITSRFEMEKELRRAKQTAEETVVMKDRFVANISHELRTPMNAIVGFTELLLKTKLTPEQQEYIQAVHIAGNNLTAMINDVLDIAKIEAGKIEFEAKPFNVRNIMSDTHRLLSQRAMQVNLNFEWKCDERVPVYVLGDELRLTQVLINLVGNAVKFTERGFVHFSCTVTEESESSVSLEFMVEDSGIGIPEEKIDAIFDPFIQASAESTRKFGGTGLGLSIVRDLAELQGGSVGVRSAVGIGSTFTVTIPYKKVSMEVVQQVEHALQPSQAPGHVRVLIVEDQPLNQQLAKKLISDFGFTAEIAINGKAALEILRNDPDPFDVVLMDLQMPELDGYDAAKLIRTKLQLAIPIIAVTAHSSSGEREKCLNIGMNDYLVKPFRAQELYFKIASVLKKQHVDEVPPAEPPAEESPLRSLAAGDKKFEREMLGILLKSLPEDFAAAQQAFVEENYPQLKSIAHRIKSSVALAGEKQAAEKLDEIEKLAAAADKVALANAFDGLSGRIDSLMLRIQAEHDAIRAD
jgi:hypothetical protein